MQEIPLKIWNPLGETRYQMTISSTIDHLGNRVAEGDMHPSMFWPTLAKYKHMEAKRNWNEYISLRNALEAKGYRDAWVGRYLWQIDFLQRNGDE